MRYAVILNGEVMNVVLWDGVSEWAPLEGSVAIACPDDVGPRWSYVDGGFVAPVVPELPPITVGGPT